MKYNKTPLNSEQHLELLKSRGLIVNNEQRAIKYLENIGYFRLTGYMFHLQSKDGNHTFLKSISFEDIIQIYQFDKKLKLLMIDYIERIEVAMRAQLSNNYSTEYGFFWYANKDLFQDKEQFNQLNKFIKTSFARPQELFLKSFKKKYIEESIPPSNMAMEILTLGKLSRLFSSLKNNEQKQAISKHFGLPSNIVASWLAYLTIIRNVSAHHSRLWNRTLLVAKPLIPKKRYKFKGQLPNNFNSSMYGVISIIDRILQAINKNNSFTDKVTDLIDSYPMIDTQKMGFPKNWKTDATWRM